MSEFPEVPPEDLDREFRAELWCNRLSEHLKNLSNSGDPPDSKAVVRAMEFLREIMVEDPVAYASGDGTVALEWPSQTTITFGPSWHDDRIEICG